MIFLRLFCIFATVQSVFSPEIHDLHYNYTAPSKPISQPGVYQFTAMGILDDRQIDFYNNTDKVKKPLQKWMEQHNDKDHSEKGTQSRRRMEQWSDFSIKILMECMHQKKSDPDVHILQWMHGCQVEKTPDGKLKFLKGFDQYGCDGDDFLSFNMQHTQQVHFNRAESTKQIGDDESIRSWYSKEYLQTDCVHWVEKLLKYQDLELQTFSPPEVHFFSKKSTSPDYRTLVCLATGFYPKNVLVNILKDGVPLAESDKVNSSGVRPNGERKETFQLRKWLEIEASDTSKYSCRIHHRTLASPIEESWDGKCRNCDGDNTGAIVGGVVVLLIVLVTVPVVLYILCRRNNAAQAPANGLNHPLTGVKLETRGSNDSVDSGNVHCLLRRGSTDSGEPKEVTEPLVANGVISDVQRSRGSLYSNDSGRGSTAFPGPKEEVNQPMMGNEEGEQKPQL